MRNFLLKTTFIKISLLDYVRLILLVTLHLIRRTKLFSIFLKKYCNIRRLVFQMFFFPIQHLKAYWQPSISWRNWAERDSANVIFDAFHWPIIVNFEFLFGRNSKASTLLWATIWNFQQLSLLFIFTVWNFFHN